MHVFIHDSIAMLRTHNVESLLMQWAKAHALRIFQSHPQFLLHFLIHIDVLMLCRKFELILTKTF